MNQLFNKMRELSIRDLKKRREEIFQRTRKIMEMKGNHSSDEESYQQTENAATIQESISAMQQQLPFEKNNTYNNNKNKKKQDANNRIRRYWRKLLQVTDWMLQIPNNLKEFYVAPRPDGNKCLAIFKDYRMQLRDKSGNLIISFQTKSKLYDKTILQAYYNQELKILIFSDLIVWKDNPMTSSQFQFRFAWLISNLNIPNLKNWTNTNVFVIKYFPCDWEGLKEAYSGELPYPKEGLIFIHKDSFYLHGLNPNVLIWKDVNISKYLSTEIQQNKLGSKGIGFLNKFGQIKTIENVSLFNINRKTIDPNHRFIRFSYTDMNIQNLQGDQVKVYFTQLKIIDSVKHYNGPIDSLGKLLYKCKIGSSMIKIEAIAQKCNEVEVKSE